MFLLDSSFQFNQMNAKDGTYLKKIFIEARYDTVKMYIHRYAAKKDIYLPKLGYKKAKLIVHRNDNTNFENKLGGNPVIHVPGIGNVEIRTNMIGLFTIRTENGLLERMYPIVNNIVQQFGGFLLNHHNVGTFNLLIIYP